MTITINIKPIFILEHLPIIKAPLKDQFCVRRKDMCMPLLPSEKRTNLESML